MSGLGGGGSGGGGGGGSTIITAPVGNQTKTQSIAVTLSTDEPNISVSGTVTANVGTTNGLALDSNLVSLLAKFGSLGQKTMAGSAPVVIASDQSTLPVSLSSFPALSTGSNTIGKVDQGLGGVSAWKTDSSAVTQPISAAALPLPTGAATSALQTTGNTSLNSIDSKVIAVNTGAVVVSSSALPTGASTAANQTTTNSSLSSIDTKTPALISGRQPVDGSGVTQPISASSLPLPSGAATSVLQTSGNSSLSSIDGKITTVNTGAVVISSSALPSGAATSALQTTGNTSLSSIDGKTATLVSGRIPVDGSGVVQPTKFADSTNMDALGRLRVSNPFTIFDSKQLVDNQPLFWDDQQTTGASTTSTYITNQAATRIAVANTTAGTRVRQTFQRFQYQPGKSLKIILTGVLGTGVTGVTKRLGYFDTSNGAFFQLLGTTLSVNVRSNTSGSPADTTINQTSWNLDKLDGTGTSGVTLDVTKAETFIIDFQWLGAGRIRFGFIIGGILIYAHQVLNANIISTVYMSVPNLPCRYEISNSGAGAAASLDHISSTVLSEGGVEKHGPVFCVDRGINALTTNSDTNIYPLLAIRLKSNYQMAVIDILAFNVIVTTGATYRYALLLNPVVSGTALTFTGVTNSAIEAQVGAINTTNVSGGTQILSGYVDATGQQGNLAQDVHTGIKLGSTIAGVSDILVFAIQRITGTAETFFGSLSWRESI